MTNIKEELIKLGLGENEAEIYLAGLGMGAFSASAIAQRTKIKRSTTYLALSNLINAGLVAETFQSKKKLFRAEGPKNLEKLTKRMRRKVIQAESIVETLTPVLQNLKGQNSAEKPHTVLYKGTEGIKNVLLDVAASSRSWYFFGSTSEILKKISPQDLAEILDEGEKFRQQSGRPKIYFITDIGMLKLKEFTKPDTTRREVKIMPDITKVGSGFIINENKLVLLDFTTGFAIVIDSKELVGVVKFMYQMIWKSLG